MSHESSPLSAGVPFRATDFTRSKFSFAQTDINNISDTSYTVGTPEIAVRFMAPTSGRVAVVLQAGCRNNGANADRIFVTYRILEGDPDDGDLFQTDEVKFGRSNPATGADEHQYAGALSIVSGLTPGQFYYAQVRHRTTLGSGTADVAYRGILVFPVS